MAGTFSQMMGNIQKAVIEITDTRTVSAAGRSAASAAPKSENKEVPSSSPGEIQIDPAVSAGGSSGAPGLSALGGLPAIGALPTAENPATTANVRSRIEELLPTAVTSSKKRFTVQFNPNELFLSGHGGGLHQKTDYSNGGDISFEPVEVRITMNVRLIFDQVDPADAFMAEKFNLAPTALAAGAAKAVLKTKGKKENSVQDEVEAFIAALRSPYTRRIAFIWGPMFYEGILNRVSAQYTMFNVSGQPVRAVVALSLVCADEAVSPDSMGAWQPHYQKAFEGGNKSLAKRAQQLGNLLNFNL